MKLVERLRYWVCLEVHLAPDEQDKYWIPDGTQWEMRTIPYEYDYLEDHWVGGRAYQCEAEMSLEDLEEIIYREGLEFMDCPNMGCMGGPLNPIGISPCFHFQDGSLPNAVIRTLTIQPWPMSAKDARRDIFTLVHDHFAKEV